MKLRPAQSCCCHINPSMGLFVKYFLEYVFFSFLLTLAHAFDEDFEERWKRMRKKPAFPPGAIIAIFVGLMVAGTLISLFCYCFRRQSRMLNASPYIPPSLAPATPSVTSGARTHTPLESYPLVSGATLPPAVPNHQQTSYPQPTAPYPQGGPYMDNNTTPLIQQSSTVLPFPSAPCEPLPYERPPPYVPHPEETRYTIS